MNKYLEGIKKSDDSILNTIYKECFKDLKHFILNNSGNEEDAKDVFQETLISIFRRLRKEDFEIATSFRTYFFTAGKYVWYRKLKKNIEIQNIDTAEFNQEVEVDHVQETRYELFTKNMLKLGPDCQKVLHYFFEKKSFKEIANLMAFKSEGYARRKKYLCTKALIKKIKLDSDYIQLKNA